MSDDPDKADGKLVGGSRLAGEEWTMGQLLSESATA
jgi:hypothetical protein